MSRLDRIVANLLRVVPDPSRSGGRPTASFAALKVGQKIACHGTEYMVASTDSQGAWLCNTETAERVRLEDREWRTRGTWRRVRAARKAKEKRKNLGDPPSIFSPPAERP